MSAAISNEEILIIETPERVPLHFALASIGNRFLACAFDHALQTLAIALLYLVFTVVGNLLDFGGLKNAPKWALALLDPVDLRHLVELFHHLRVAVERADARQALVEIARHPRGWAAHHFLGSGGAQSPAHSSTSCRFRSIPSA